FSLPTSFDKEPLFCRVNGVQKPVSRYEVKFKQKCEKPFSQNFS
ncbi:hypothetical protein HMPREF1372_00818, partial [Enterococcus faecium P1139]